MNRLVLVPPAIHARDHPIFSRVAKMRNPKNRRIVTGRVLGQYYMELRNIRANPLTTIDVGRPEANILPC